MDIHNKKGYTRDFIAPLRLISWEEIQKYSNKIEDSIIVGQRPDVLIYLSANKEGAIHYQEIPHPENEIDDIGSSAQNDSEEEYDGKEDYNNEEDYEYDDDDYYDEDYDEDYGYEIAGIAVGHIKNLKNLEIKNNTIQINGQEFVVLDEKEGLVALRESIEWFDDYYDEGCQYVGSYMEFMLSDINKQLQNSELVGEILPISKEEKEKYELSDSDFNIGKASNVIISGETGCGKTYKAVMDEIQSGNRFIYIAPTRQLAYDTFRTYGDKDADCLTTGECKIGSKENSLGNVYAVYESISPDDITSGKFDTLIIDEAHFIKDPERGSDLINLISVCREKDINIKLVTATQNFTLNDFEEIHLASEFKTPEKIEVDYDTAVANLTEKKLPTIWFCESIRDTAYQASYLQSQGIKAVAMNSSMPPSECMKALLDFESGEVDCICSTNKLAQGVNLTAANMIIESDMWESPEQQEQKKGRLGRIGTLPDMNEVYYFISSKEGPVKKDTTKTKIEKSLSNRSFIEDQLECAIYAIDREDRSIDYNDIKYCQPQFVQYAKERISQLEVEIKNDDTGDYHLTKNKERYESALQMIEEEHEKIKELILSHMKGIPNISNDKIITKQDNIKNTAGLNQKSADALKDFGHPDAGGVNSKPISSEQKQRLH